MKKRKKLRFIIKTDRPLLQDAHDRLMQCLEDFEKGTKDVLLLNDFIKVDVFDEFNNYITTL